jgi:hypothetical protein
MRFIFLILMWITPALIAGMLGWRGIWGSGSAFADYLIPIPVAGGVLHVPSFIVAATIIMFARNLPASISRYLPVLAFAVFLAAQSLQLDFERINSWLFTDYTPYGSPFRFAHNPFYLFISTDAFWVGIYALTKGYTTPLRYWLLLPVVPVAIIGLHAFGYQTNGPVFRIGGSLSGKARGNEIHLVYTSSGYDEKMILDWIERNNYAKPWTNPNSEHDAIYFTNSMQVIKWRKFDKIDTDNTVATVCLYEEDRSVKAYKGYYNCFKDRKTVEEKIMTLFTRNKIGLGRDIDHWYARVQLCASVVIPEDNVLNIELFNICNSMISNHKRYIERFYNKYGENSAQANFVRSKVDYFKLGQE